MILDISYIEWISLKACIMTEQNNICAMCKRELRDPEFTLHHIRKSYFKPEIDNQMGYKYPEEIILTEKYNFQPICPKCNSKNIYLAKLEKGKLHCHKCNYIGGKEEFYLKKAITKRPLITKKPLITKRPNKYMLKYGRSLKDIAKIFGVTRATIHNWNKSEKKKEWMEEILKNL